MSEERPMHCLRLRQPDSERGAALFLAILTLFILTIMGIALMFTTSIENTLAGTETKVSKIFYAADSGIEYAGAMLSSQVNYSGGPMPVGVSSHYPTLSPPDMTVTISQPVIIGYTLNVGDPFSSGGHVYDPNAFYEVVYGVTSSASSTAIQAAKAIDAEVGVYPKQLSIPRPN
jgi:hypothetical protein